MNQNDKLSSRYFGSAIWIFAAAAAIYVGTYFALLERKVYMPIGVEPATNINLYEIIPRYRVPGQYMEKFLSPAHWIDRMLRDDFWETIESRSGRKWKNPPPSGR